MKVRLLKALRKDWIFFVDFDADGYHTFVAVHRQKIQVHSSRCLRDTLRYVLGSYQKYLQVARNNSELKRQRERRAQAIRATKTFFTDKRQQL